MTTASTWVVPGCALPRGRGWKIWYSRPGRGDFRPPAVTVRRGDRTARTRETWALLPPLSGLDRRMGVLTVTIQEPAPGAEYGIVVNEPGVEEFRWHSLPGDLPEDGVTFLLASCFWHNGDREGHYLAAVKALRPPWRPAFKLLVGDQVYGDWPVDASPDLSGDEAVAVYGDRYAAYWGDEAYRAMMGTSPNFFLCDDHEFWNDYPEVQFHLARTWPRVRGKYAAAADALYERYQACNNPGSTRWYRFEIGEVSFFFADTRSQRDCHTDDGAAHFIQEPQWRDLEAWGRELVGPGILVLGQPIYQPDGDWRDHSLSNFVDDYSRLWRVMERALEGGGRDGKPHDILVLSGDIHTGRLAVGRRPDKTVYELIASPASMIHPGSSSPSEPSYRFAVGRPAERRIWAVDAAPFMSLDDNVALVRMRRGTNGRVAMELGSWRVRPFDDRSWWDKLRGQPREEGPFQFLMTKEIELR